MSSMINVSVYYYLLMNIGLFLLFSLPAPWFIQKLLLKSLTSSVGQMFQMANKYMTFLILICITMNYQNYKTASLEHEYMNEHDK